MNVIPKKLGRYLIVREIGRGAMGVVYKAHDPVIEREVAVKAINLNFQVTDEEKTVYLNRFYREAKAAGKLNHPGIVTIYDVDEDKESSSPFIVMEYLEGTTLQEVVSGGTILPIEQSADIVTQVADALSYAHQHGIVHRDVKSANVLILANGKAKITDFGIARLPSSDLTRSGQFVGTPNYMSPEQIEGKSQLDGRSDLFSLGVIFYMLLTGERPFSGDSFNTVAYKIVNIDPLPAKALNPEVPEGYNAILNRLLAKDPSKRYESGVQLVADLRKVKDPDYIGDAPFPPLPKPETSEGAAVGTPGEKEQIAMSQTITLFRRKQHVRWTIYAGILLSVLTLLAAGTYFYSRSKAPTTIVAKAASPSTKLTGTPPNTGVKPEQPAEETNKDIIRRKWDLAMNYFQNALYDKSIQELQEILLLNPNDQEAKKYLEMVINQKEAEAKKKDDVLKAKTTTLPAPTIPTTTAKNKRNNRSVKSRNVATNVQPLPPPVNVRFELEHSFQSGVLNIYLENKLIYQTEFQGTKKKVLLFTNYQGKVAGSFTLPTGSSILDIQLVSKPSGVAVVRQSRVIFQEGEHPFLKIRYFKNTKQLDLKWM